MKKYDSYKDSGIEWIGEIPSHWETKRIRHIADIFGRIGYRGYTLEDIVFDESGAISLSPSNIENQKLTLESVTRITQEKYEESPEIKVFENDVVLVKTASVGKAAIVRPLNDLATINPQLVVFKNYRIDQTFFYYEIISRVIQNQITQDLNGGVVNTITQTNLNNYSIIVPPPEEQTAIAAYLDRKTAEIDELIADKKRLLELYEEEKTAIINQAVTKGINPDAPMKDSGIEWLGEIPEHWEVKRLKYVGESIIGIIYSPNDIVPSSENAKLVLRASNIQNGELALSDSVYVTTEIRDNQTLKKGDILICSRSGSEALIGKNILIDDRVAGETFGAFMTVFRTDISSFVYYYFNSQVFKGQTALFKTSTINQLTVNTLNNFVIAVPQIEEQQSIVRHIENETARIDAKKSKTKKLIELLTEYRTALISEVVTGKIKVIE